ncbi:hypothetical protein [Wenzhouxiangella sp. XN24]|uniref:hypothetical protein n=1 Tax=Wenzhouxiangella sp. XN24 TaxID=2713569 RepID=UPI0013EA69EC|nr:hypothetical protein [Wenzhouxiangella sp. XN24]NGX15676.1 hypothetical protein [Wenzhouxiangella sp. XN24]
MRYRFMLAGILLSAVLLAAAAGVRATEAPPTVRDLAWGEVLFEHYQGRRMEALVRLSVGQVRGELAHHGAEAELLKGGLYLAWGLRDEAAEIFTALLAGTARPAQRDAAWYWLARIHHERGEHAKAAAALGRIGAPLPAAMQADRVDLEGRVLIALGRNADAAELFAGSAQPGAWRGFAEFNRAVALARSDHLEAALPILEELGGEAAGGPESAVLRDRANLALGLARLDANDPAGARAALDRVRLDGPYAARALLAAGWAEAQRENYRGALGPWTALTAAADFDGAALEAMLAIPWAWHQLDETGESVAGYERAAAACDAELLRLGAAQSLARGEALLSIALADNDLPPVDGPLAPYLHALAADHPFRAVASDLRDLAQLRENLLTWRHSLAALRDMVETRRARFEQVAPRAEFRLEQDRLGPLRSRYRAAEAHLATLRASGAQARLATPAEQELLSRLEVLEMRVLALPDGADREDLHARHARLEGALHWQLNHAWPKRIYAAERGLANARRELEAGAAARASLTAALAAGPAGFEGFDARIDAAAARVEDLLLRVEQDQGRRTEALRALALQELQAREQRVAAYLGQARFALAAAYDQATQPRAAREALPGPATETAP